MRNLFGVIFLILSVLHLVLTFRFLRRLQSEHHEVWVSLGKPRYTFFPRLPKTDYLRFLLKREYKQLGDSATGRLAGWLFWTSIAWVVCISMLVLIDVRGGS